MAALQSLFVKKDIALRQLNQIEWKTSSGPVPYEDAVRAMEDRAAEIRAGTGSEMVWFLEHPSLYTAGASAKDSDLLDPGAFPVHKTGRGGQYTYHGPGQRIVYVMLDLETRGPDLHQFVRRLEQWLIDSLAHFGVTGERRHGRVGVWVELGAGREAKIAALGIRVRRWVTFHGVSLNVAPDLSHYDGIIACGVPEHGVTSLEALGVKVSMAVVDAVLKEKFEDQFGV
ncbi:MAG: lipoyl(octanoyl) transferase LipB [Rhodospirillaceae bacterium]|nr:lipoyl(octanoyl) transferase LipB [Rhodospirillaceae bacterium]MBT5040353.1 lipoyl(octanoyl) transferase LipB [Rhodospirillaceae bacterium]MBT5677557.1 lipoyl(octanoyl) transferase LipB [Rhodospirillaceae bacterium]MBT5777846.1 lipoyl(octanoyl) transferase LipB [Rhodospirillaceae bacterium]